MNVLEMFMQCNLQCGKSAEKYVLENYTKPNFHRTYL